MKFFYYLILLFCIPVVSFSQSQEKAIGIRAGLSSGFEYRVFSSEQTSYKVLLSFRKQGLQLTGLKEIHVPDAFGFLPELSFVYGLGAHAGFESWYRYGYYDINYPTVISSERRSGPIAGLDALAALEYTVPEIPIVFGVEVKPYFNLFGRDFFQLQPFDFAFTVKYSF